MTKSNPTNKDLLIRIDERQQRVLEDIIAIKNNLERKVNNDDEFKTMKEKVDKLWDFKNKMLGYGAGAGAIASIVINVIEHVLNK